MHIIKRPNTRRSQDIRGGLTETQLTPRKHSTARNPPKAKSKHQLEKATVQCRHRSKKKKTAQRERGSSFSQPTALEPSPTFCLTPGKYPQGAMSVLSTNPNTRTPSSGTCHKKVAQNVRLFHKLTRKNIKLSD